MPSPLIWSVESVSLGLWALSFAAYSTPLHVFIARSHVLISSFTMVLHLVVVARDLVVGSAVSQSFLCAVSALFLTYVSAVLVPGVDTVEPKFFKLPSVGLLRLDAVIGLAWFTVAMLSGLGMALSHIRKEPGMKRARMTLLMFHSYGVHLLVIFPCIAIIHASSSFSVTLLLDICAIVWLVYVVYMTVTLFGVDITSIVLGKNTTFQSLRWYQMVLFVLFYVLHIIFRFAPIAISLAVLLFVDLRFQPRVLVLCLLGVAVLTSLDAFTPLNFNCLPTLCGIPTLDGFFGRQWESEHDDAPSAPPGVEEETRVEAPAVVSALVLPSTYPGASDVPTDPKVTLSSRMRFLPFLAPPLLPRYSFHDPAAVSIRREKNV